MTQPCKKHKIWSESEHPETPIYCEKCEWYVGKAMSKYCSRCEINTHNKYKLKNLGGIDFLLCYDCYDKVREVERPTALPRGDHNFDLPSSSWYRKNRNGVEHGNHKRVSK